MPDFGNAGTRTVHASEAACTIDASAGEFILCTVDVKGALALFTFACTHNGALVTPTGPPQSRYQWMKYDEEHSKVKLGDNHTLSLMFSGGATWYRFRMELFDANMALLKTLKDVEFESSDPTDVAVDFIRLRAK
jgi:hypothetical protein